jgi:hypothetical protein
MSFEGAALFQLLPALYRLQDAEVIQGQSLLTAAEAAQLASLQASAAALTSAQQAQLDELTAKAGRGPLQSLLMLVAEQLAAVEDDLDQLYDNQFIETCADWVIPYIGDLIGYQPVKGVAQAVASPRAEVANTISLRRRKGTVLVLEQLARDVTGWGAHAVEFFKRLGVTQYMNHLRPYSHYAPDLRRWQPRAYMNTGFDTTSHTVDTRRIAIGRGCYNIQNVGIFLWSLTAYPLTNSPASAVAANPRCFRLSPLGCDMPLFTNPVSQGANIKALAQPFNVPGRLRSHVLCHDIREILNGAAALYYGDGLSLALYLDNTLLAPAQLQVCDLSGPEASWTNLPLPAGSYAAAIDPLLGRLKLSTAVGQPAIPSVTASFHYGFNADMGGGEYPRAATFTASPEQPVIRVPGDFSTVQAALDALGGDGVVEITDSGRYTTAGGMTVSVAANGHIELRAQERSRPVLALGGEITVTGGAASRFDMNGLLIISTATPAPPAPIALVHAPMTDSSGNPNALGQLNILHCTLVPGWALTPQGGPIQPGQPSLIAEPSGVQVSVQRSILGGMHIQPQATASIVDSVIDASSPASIAYAGLDGVHGGGALTLQGCTVIGKVHATLLSLVSNSIFWAELASGDTWQAPLWADRKQAGCLRFSYLPQNPLTPRKFECVTEAAGRPGPLFASLRYGDPDYAKLLPVTDDTIRRGADDGGEMGAFHFVLAPQRETDLLIRIGEYLPVGLECGIIYQN